MKKTIALFLILVSILSACSAAPTHTEIDEATARSFVKYNFLHIAETEDALYFVDSWSGESIASLIYYIDKDTGVGGPLCGKPECGHDNADCNAFTRTYTGDGVRPTFPGTNGAKGLFIQNNRLYWAVYTGSMDGITIFSSALDGTDHRQVGKAGKNVIPNTRNNHFITWSEKYAFFSCEAKSVTNAVATDRNYICAIPLNSEEETIVVLDEETNDNYVTPMQVYDGYLYFITNDLNGPVDKIDEESRTFKIRRWDLETHETETVFEDPDSDIDSPYLMWVTDDQILFNDFYEGHGEHGENERCVDRYDFETGECGYLYDLDVPNTEGLLDTSFGDVNFADGIAVGHKLLQDGYNSFKVVIKDFDGNTLLDEVYRPEATGAQARRLYMNGADKDYIYFTFIKSDESYYDTDLTFVSVARDGSGLRTIGTVELPPPPELNN